MIVLDLEWNRGYDKTPLEEILQIGAVRIDKPGGKILDTFSIFIQPCVHKKFNRTAKALPDLQSALDSEIHFPEAVEAFIEWCGEDTVFADWGGDDFEVLRQNCAFWKVPAPQPTQLIDFQAAFSLQVNTNQGVALCRAVEYCRIPTPFTFHNALNDAVYTALVSAWITEDTLTLIALPKEIRRLMKSPPFPPQSYRQSGPYTSLQSALNSRDFRRQVCPICGDPIWVRRWYTSDLDRYYADFRCRTHGSFLCRLALSSTVVGLWQGFLSVPPITAPLLQEFSTALHTASVSCKGRHRKKYSHRSSHRSATKHP